MSSFSHYFSKKFQHICVSLDVKFNELLTNDIVSFEQLGPDCEVLIHDSEAGVNLYSHLPDNTVRYLMISHSKEKICRYQHDT